jgi:hypothetical protein
MNASFRKEQYICGPGMPLLNSGNWNPALHPRDPSNGEFIYTDGGLHGRSGTTTRNKNNDLTHYRGVPPNSRTFKTLNGTTFVAPGSADFKAVYYSGQASGLTPWSMYADIWHYGIYDFQRNMGQGYKTNGNTFYDAYIDASNYAVGVYLNGAGQSLQNSLRIAATAAKLMSSNAGSPRQALWTCHGWQAANAGKPNGI